MEERLKKLTIAVLLVLVIVLGYYQIVKGDYFFKKSRLNYLRIIPQKSLRGIIYDRHHQALVKNTLSFQACLFPHTPQRQKVLSALSRVLQVEKKILEDNFHKNIIAPFIPVPVYTFSSVDKAIRLEEKNIEGLIIKVVPQREVVSPFALAQVVGYVQSMPKALSYLRKYGFKTYQDFGISGLEAYYDDYLRGKEGGVQVEVNSRGEVRGVLGKVKPQKGKDLFTSLDLRMQDLAYRLLEEKRQRGVILLMDPYSGEIMVMVSYPSFNANRISDAAYFRRLLRNSGYPFLNRSLQGEYPPGSVFKPVVALAALEKKKVSLATKFFCDGTFNFKGTKYRCWSVHGWQSLLGALAVSCDIYFYNLGLRVGVEPIVYYARMLGLGALSGVDLPQERRGLLPSPAWKRHKRHQSWYKGDTINLSIGQGYLLVTPLQIARLMSVFANGGYLVRPHLVRKIESVSLGVKKEKLHLNPAGLRWVRKGMRFVVSRENGTAHILEDLGLEIAGKTGTAQTSAGPSHGWFGGFFPYHNPKYVIVVFLENGKSSHNACILAKEFLKEAKDKGWLSNNETQ